LPFREADCFFYAIENPPGAFYHLRQNPYSFRGDPFDARLQLPFNVPD
jgi:hypothetical protein